MEKRNVTLSLPEPLLQKLRVVAAKRNSSMSGLMENAIYKLLETDDAYDMRAKRLIERMKNAPGRGIGGKITWTREEIHDRIR
ncbi:MAG TPA: ribbon-helix-helix protein, CopG family [Bryobacteraceae bacterium]